MAFSGGCFLSFSALGNTFLLPDQTFCHVYTLFSPLFFRDTIQHLLQGRLHALWLTLLLPRLKLYITFLRVFLRVEASPLPTTTPSFENIWKGFTNLAADPLFPLSSLWQSFQHKDSQEGYVAALDTNLWPIPITCVFIMTIWILTPGWHHSFLLLFLWLLFSPFSLILPKHSCFQEI